MINLLFPLKKSRKFHLRTFRHSVFFGSLALFSLLLLTTFVITKGPIPPTSEIAYTEHSPGGEEAGSVVPASCDSAVPFGWSGLYFDRSSGVWRNSGSHFNGDCLTACPAGMRGTYDPYYNPSASGCCVANTGWGCWSAGNACGQSGWGTISCGGACSGVTPPNPSGYGNGCWGAPNDCGWANWGTIGCSGGCSAAAMANPWWLYRACTATNACGASNSGTYTCAGVCSVGAPALPSGYGNGCWGAPNDCGWANWGTIGCSGGCSAAAMDNPWWLYRACTATNACGASNSGTLTCAGVCSVGAPALPSGYGNACTSAANACGWTAAGTLDCSLACTAGVPANPVGYGNVCQGPANACGMTIAGTIGCSGCNSTVAPANALCDLAVCKNNCTSEIDRTGNFTVASGTGSTMLKACFYQAGTRACASGVDVTGSATWTETNAPKDTIYFSSTGVLETRFFNGDEIFNTSYLGVTKSPRVTVTCIPNACSIAPAKVITDTYCPEVTQDTGVPTGCDGLTLICPGTRKCNYNWREVAP